MTRALSLWLLAAVSIAGQAGVVRADSVVRFALVIGNNHSPTTDRRELRYADDDAVAMHSLLVEANVSCTLLVEPDAMTKLRNPQLSWRPAALTEVERVKVALAEQVRVAKTNNKTTELIFFFSGHGEVDSGEGYIGLKDQRLSRAGLTTLLTTVGADYNHVMIDACSSYFMVYDRGPGGRRSEFEGASLATVLPAELGNTGVLLSTSSDRESHEWERYRAGIFSQELRSALRSAADADRDGAIRYSEIGGFLMKANARIAPTFRPQFTVRSPAKDSGRPALRWPKTASTIQIAAMSCGHLYIENTQGERLADLHPAPGETISVRVSAARPLFVRCDDGSSEYVVELDSNQVVDPLSARPQAIASKGAQSLAYELLFSLPFAASDVSAFDQQQAASILSVAPTQQNIDSSRPITWTVAGGTALLGVATGILSVLKHNEFRRVDNWIEREVPTDEQVVAEQKKGQRLEVASFIALGLTAAAAVSTVTLFFVEPGLHGRATELSFGPGSVSIRSQF